MPTKTFVTEFCSYTERRRRDCASGVSRESHGNCTVYTNGTAVISGCKYRNSKVESHSRVHHGSIDSVQGYLNLIGTGATQNYSRKGDYVGVT